MKKHIKIDRRSLGVIIVLAITVFSGALYCIDFPDEQRTIAKRDGLAYSVITKVPSPNKEANETELGDGGETILSEPTAEEGLDKPDYNPFELNDPSDNSNKININTADKAQLMTLPGIGEAKAERIISFRNEHGGFKNAEDIMLVSGIKQASFDKFKDKICVK